MVQNRYYYFPKTSNLYTDIHWPKYFLYNTAATFLFILLQHLTSHILAGFYEPSETNKSVHSWLANDDDFRTSYRYFLLLLQQLRQDWFGWCTTLYQPLPSTPFTSHRSFRQFFRGIVSICKILWTLEKVQSIRFNFRFTSHKEYAYRKGRSNDAKTSNKGKPKLVWYIYVSYKKW